MCSIYKQLDKYTSNSYVGDDVGWEYSSKRSLNAHVIRYESTSEGHVVHKHVILYVGHSWGYPKPTLGVVRLRPRMGQTPRGGGGGGGHCLFEVATHCQTAPVFQGCPPLSFLKSNLFNAKLYTKVTQIFHKAL